ncbi:MAG: acetyltransferase [Betaproteobacteria bacterium SG8_40]|jgi:GNAT superfamily N-acetyltransferase|nr:MAG: acetyltransferase [Betaproteobacteria bacterium SG8_40]
MSIEIRRFCGNDAHPYIKDLARLRIEVFREFPYLYAGSLGYESDYLRTYLDVPDSVVVIALDGGRVVGVSTGLPLAAETDNVKQPFVDHHRDPEKVFYFGESVLQKPYRGKGLGVRFFEEREAHARMHDRFGFTAFCAVHRDAGHHRRPADYVPLDDFWIKRGYRKHPELSTAFSWQDLDEVSASPKLMIFWLKRITRDPAA